MGNLYLWQTAMVSALKQRGVYNTFSNCLREACIETDGMASIKERQQQIHLVKEKKTTSSIYCHKHCGLISSFSPFSPQGGWKLTKQN